MRIIAHRLQSPNIGYIEKHHIFPQSIYGANKTLVSLSFREHLICHWLLVKHYYKTEGDTSANFRKMSCAFIRMCSSNKKNQYLSMTDITAHRISSRMFEAAKNANRIAMTGIGNPYFGMKHTPEILAKIQANRSPMSLAGIENIKRSARKQGLKTKGMITVYNEEDNIIKRIRDADIETYKRQGYVLGHRPADNKARSKALQGRKLTWEIKKGEDHYLYGMIHMYHEVLGRLRVKADDQNKFFGLGYKLGMNKSKEALERVRAASTLANKGKPKPYMDNVNKDPEKIRKTAEKHRGMKRSELTRQRISEKAKGRACSFTGSITAYNVETLEVKRFFNAESIPDGWLKGDPRLRGKRKTPNV